MAYGIKVTEQLAGVESPPTIQVPRIQTRSSSLVAMPFPSEPSHGLQVSFFLLSRSGGKRAESLITSKSCGWFLQIRFERREPEEATVAEDSREVGVEGGEAGSVKLGHVQGMETSVSKVLVKPQSLMSRLV